MDPRPDQPTADELLERALFEVKHVVVGQDAMIERLLVSAIAGGHCLLEGPPGLAKTLAAKTLATVLGGTFTRIQFTPDLLPADLVGTRIYRPSREQFDVETGPVFANVVLADEINRASPKVQSALLEVMAERQVSIGGTTFAVPAPFMVLATQNPIESEGVYPLPEAQRDRFLMKVARRLPERSGGGRDRPPGQRQPAGGQPAADPRRLGRPAVGRPAGVRARRRRRLRRAPRRRHPPSGGRPTCRSWRRTSPTASARAPPSGSSPRHGSWR